MFEEEVRNGAAWLDERHPGWYNRIDLPSLDLGACTKCILGQLFSTYFQGRKINGLSRDQALNMGFNVPIGERIPKNWQALTGAWISIIKEKRGESIKTHIKDNRRLIKQLA